ncbi:MAG: stage II sporulation protein R [Alkaliphilus sp.]
MKKKYIQLLIIIFLLAITFINIQRDNKISSNAYDNLIRFHVMANSDSPTDQRLKLKVRNNVISFLNSETIRANNIEEARENIAANLHRINEVAFEEIADNGKKYNVKVAFEKHIFPTRKYGNVVLPAGEYESLRVIIGEGKGKNWWCVMFPPLCFIDVKHGLIDEETRKELKKILSEEEYKKLYNATQDEIPIQLRSKIWDWVMASREEISRAALMY